MAIQSSGAIKLSEIQTEFTGSNPISMSEYYRGAGYTTGNNTSVPETGAISISNFYGTKREFAFTISTNYTTTQDLRTLAIEAGWDEVAPVVATVDSGVEISGDGGSPSGAGSTALTIQGDFPAGVSLINNGSIVGGGGGGGPAVYGGSGYPGGAGGIGLVITTAISITNNGNIAGGGGGGGGCGAFGTGGVIYSGGGGGGGAAYGGASGGYYASGAAGTFTTGGAGAGSEWGGVAGNGGGWGANGGTGSSSSTSGGAGGAAGAAVSGNSNVTWVAEGSIYGALV